FCVVAREREPTAPERAGHQLFEPGLINRWRTRTQPRHLGLIDVHAGNPMTQVSEADGRRQSDVAGSDDRDGTHLLQSVTKGVYKPPHPAGRAIEAATWSAQGSRKHLQSATGHGESQEGSPSGMG